MSPSLPSMLLHRPAGRVLVLILAVAFITRALLIPHGLPLLLHEDEPIYLDTALRFGLGDWDLTYFKKPSFFLYFYAFFYGVAFLYSPILDWATYVEQFWLDPTYVTTVGRTVSVLFATASAALLYRIGQRAFSTAVGLGAALLLALDATHLRFSPVVLSDIPSLFFVLLSGLMALRLAEKGRLKDYWRTGLAIALVMSFKYNVFTGVFLLAAHTVRVFSQPPKDGNRWAALVLDSRLWLGLLIIPAVFLLLNPMTLIHFDAFWADLNLERKHMLHREVAAAGAQWELMAAAPDIFLKIIPKAIGWPLYVLGWAGMGYCLRRYTKPALVLLTFPALFLLVVSQFQLVNAKYLLPVYPFWFLAASVLVVDGIHWLKVKWQWSNSKTYAAAGATLALLALPDWKESWQYLVIHQKADTRNLAYRTMQRMARPGDRFMSEPATVALDNRYYREQIVVAEWTGRSFRGNESVTRTYENLRAINPRYVLIYFKADKADDGRYRMRAERQTYYQTLETRYRFRALFSPYPVHLSQAELTRTYQQHGLAPLYGRIQANRDDRNRPGPLLLLLERR